MADSLLPPSLTIQSEQMGAMAGKGAIDEERQSNMEIHLSETEEGGRQNEKSEQSNLCHNLTENNRERR